MPIFTETDNFVLFIRYCQSRLFETPPHPDMDEEEYDQQKAMLDLKLRTFEAQAARGRGYPPDHDIRDFIAHLNAILPDEDSISIDTKQWATDFVTGRNVHGIEGMSRWNCSPVNSTFHHEYIWRPKNLEINFQELIQDGRKIWVGGCKANAIDAVGSVPYIDAWIENREISRIILEGDHADNQWQRPVKLDRVIGIANFLDNDDAYLANGIMIYANLDHPSVNFNESKLTIDFNFLKKNESGMYSDHDYTLPCPDLRPIWIIDGQHRTRGAVMSERGSAMELPLILCIGGKDFKDYGLDKSDAAKMFSEINTQSKQLAEEHQLYAGDRFSIPSVKKPLDFSDTENGNKNRFAYRLAAQCCSETTSPLYDRIRMMPKRGQRDSNAIIVEIKTWMQQIRKWANIQFETPQEAIKDAMNYFAAFSNAMIKGTGDTYGWGLLGSRGKSLFENKGPFNAVLEIYPSVRNFVANMENLDGKSVSEYQYTKYMSPWSIMDFTKSRVKEKLNGRDENIKYLNTWLLTGMYYSNINNLKLPNSSDAISESIHSKPNHGLLSVPKKPIIEIYTGTVELNTPLIVGGQIPFHTKSIIANLFFSEVNEEDGYVNLAVEHEKITNTKMSNVIWESQNPNILRQGNWNVRINPEHVQEFSGAVELRVRATNFIGESEISILKLRD